MNGLKNWLSVCFLDKKNSIQVLSLILLSLESPLTLKPLVQQPLRHGPQDDSTSVFRGAKGEERKKQKKKS